MTENRTAFVTGGAGFIGLHVVEQLLERDWNVRIFDNMWRGDRDRANELAKTGKVDVVERRGHLQFTRCQRRGLA